MEGYPGAGPQPSKGQASEAVSVPGILLIVTGAIGVLFGLIGLIQAATGSNEAALDAINGPNGEQLRELVRKVRPIGGFWNVVTLAANGLVIFGAIKMRSLQSWGLALTASIISLVPCFCPSCCMGIPVGIWSLVVLLKPEVKAAFEGMGPPAGGAPPGYTPPGSPPGSYPPP